MIRHDEVTITLHRRDELTVFAFAVDVQYDFGLHLPLLFTSDEALRTLHLAKVAFFH